MRNHSTPIIRVRLIPHGLPLTQYVVEQSRVRQSAPQSQAFTPALQDILTRWDQSTDKAAALFVQEQVLASQLQHTREARKQAARQARLDEVAYAGAAEAVAQNNGTTLLSLGMLTQQPRSGVPHTAAPVTPSGLTLKPGADPGTLYLAWKKSPGARSYEVQVSLNPASDSSWVSYPPQSKRSLRLSDLRPGTVYLVRVRATGSGGSSVYSEAARGTAR